MAFRGIATGLPNATSSSTGGRSFVTAPSLFGDSAFILPRKPNVAKPGSAKPSEPSPSNPLQSASLMGGSTGYTVNHVIAPRPPAQNPVTAHVTSTQQHMSVVNRIMSASSSRGGSAGVLHGGNPRANAFGLDLAMLLANLDNSNRTGAPSSIVANANPGANTAYDDHSARRPPTGKKSTLTVATVTVGAQAPQGQVMTGSRVSSAGRFARPPGQQEPKPVSTEDTTDEEPKPSQPLEKISQTTCYPQSPRDPAAQSQRFSFQEADRPSPASLPKDGSNGKMSPAQALELYDSFLTRYERREILEYDEVYFVGAAAAKVDAPIAEAPNFGYDDERGDYNVVKGDHVAFRYEVVAELGKGSFGQVLKVHDFKKNSFCALKIIRNKKRFHQQATVEIRILDHLRSRDPEDRSCTVHMLNYFKFRSHTIITFDMHSMNLYELAKLNKYQPFAPALIKRFTAQILVAMSFMWREQIVHCDLKPENILLRYENKTSIKIIDFGSSCFETERIFTYIQSRFYRAPEIILGLSYGRPIDLWSLGCIVCEMQMGYPIFPGESEKEQLLCIMEVLGVPPSRLVDRSPRKKEFFDANGQPKLFANSRNKVRKPGTKDIMKTLRTEDASFVDFILCFLQWDPADRITPNDASQRP